MRFEHGDASAELLTDGARLGSLDSLIDLRTDELRWLVITAGPAILCELQRTEEDAGGGGGPPPATPDATEPADRADPDLFADVADDRADPHSVGCPWCKAPPGAGCTTSAGTPTRPHSPRRQLVG